MWKVCFLSNAILEKILEMTNDQKSVCSSCIATGPQNFEILLFFYMVIITLYNSKILLSLHYFLTPQFQTFTNLLIGILEVNNPTFFFFFFIGWNYVSILVLQCYLLWIFVWIRRLLQLNPSPPPTSKTLPLLFFFFSKSPLKSANYPSPFLAIQPVPHFKKTVFSCTPSPKNRIFSNIKIIILQFFVINFIPSFKSN